MQGEKLTQATIGPHGITGDRGWGLTDVATGKVLTARREAQLLFASAAITDGGVAVTLPDGTVTADDAVLSDWLGRPVTLTPSGPSVAGTFETQLDFETEEGEWFEWTGPEGSFHDSGRTQVSIVSQATLRDWNPRRFRINVTVDGQIDGADEDSLVDRAIQAGSAKLDVVKLIERCVVTTRPQPDGIDRDLDVLRTINAERGGNLGIGTIVTTPGSIRIGDEVTPTAN